MSSRFGPPLIREKIDHCWPIESRLDRAIHHFCLSKKGRELEKDMMEDLSIACYMRDPKFYGAEYIE